MKEQVVLHGVQCGRTYRASIRFWKTVYNMPLGFKLLHAQQDRWHAYHKIDDDTYMLTSGGYEPGFRGTQVTEIRHDELEG